ncbi:hypothetical protein ACJJTC_010730 [Scirpophaga incertulas]
MTEQMNIQTTIITDRINSTVLQKVDEKIKQLVEENEKFKTLRLGKKTEADEKIRPILLATTTLQKKIEILKNKKMMKTGIYITQDLTKDKKERKQINLLKTKEMIKAKKQQKELKMKKTDAFRLMRERAHSLSDKKTGGVKKALKELKESGKEWIPKIKSNDKTITQLKRICHVATTFYQNLYSNQEPNVYQYPITDITQIPGILLEPEPEILEIEVKKAIMSQKNGKIGKTG